MIAQRSIWIFILYHIFVTFSTTESKEVLSDASYSNSPEICGRFGSYTKIGNNYYKIHLAKVTWFHALHVCRREGADLATITEEYQMNAISNHLMSLGYGESDWFWIGANDLATEKTFEWVHNGEKMSFSRWSRPQPDNAGGNEDCVHLWLREGQFKMNDWNCDQGKAYFICEAPEPATVTIW
ncbi:C-type lectin 37Db-like [Teleopsis dalmanni]|uniref:C-type lectin 37Db-like n=1 Tax=Teleopsis dalmanni TaxID=139649 RepID=UPI0018CD53BA|nr:C-type lectin 37Db-like [Teleopsis dalmanni]